MNKIVIPLNVMPTLNEHDKANRGNKFGGANMKKKATSHCAMYIRNAMNEGLELENYQFPIKLKMTWFAENRRKDPDNISFAKKYILDGMIQANLIKNDGWNEISGFADDFELDKKYPRVEIEVMTNG